MYLNQVILILVFVSLTPPDVWALKRIKRNSSVESKNNRIKQDFVALHAGKQDSVEKGNNSELKDSRIAYNNSNNNAFELGKKRNVSSRPLTVILRERERKVNEHQQRANTAAEESNSIKASQLAKLARENDLEMKTNIKDGRCEATGSVKESYKNLQNKHLPHMFHTSSVVGAHVITPPRPVQQSYGVLNPFVSLGQLMKVGNMMMFKVGMDSLPYSPKIAPNFAQLQQQENFLPQNEPDFEYIEGPQGDFLNQNTRIKTNVPNNNDAKGLIITNPVKIFKSADSETDEPKDLVNLMQTALDNLLFNSNKNENEIEMKCPLHLEKKSLQNANDEDGNNADVIQVCSCRFIKRDQEHK